MNAAAQGRGIQTRWRALFSNPVLGLELRRMRRKRLCPSWWPGRRPLHLLLQLLAVVGLGVGLAALAAGKDDGGFLGILLDVIAAVWAWVLPLLAALSTARTIVSEREAATLELLRVTSLGEDGVVLGKLMAGLVRLWPAVLALAVASGYRVGWTQAAPFRVAWGTWAYAVGPAQQPGGWRVDEGPLLAAASGPWVDLALGAAVGLRVSSRARSSGTAVALSLASILAIQIGLWLLLVTLMVWIPGSPADAASLGAALVSAGGLVKGVLVILQVREAVWGLRGE